MRNKELIRYLQQFDPEAVVELNIDIFSTVGATRGSWQDRRVVQVRASHDKKCVVIEGCGSLRPNEEALLDDGLYNRAYNDYEAHWNGLYNKADRRVVLNRAELPEAGLPVEPCVELRWDELSLRVQQFIMVRNTLPGVVRG